MIIVPRPREFLWNHVNFMILKSSASNLYTPYRIKNASGNNLLFGCLYLNICFHQTSTTYDSHINPRPRAIEALLSTNNLSQRIFLAWDIQGSALHHNRHRSQQWMVADSLGSCRDRKLRSLEVVPRVTRRGSGYIG